MLTSHSVKTAFMTVIAATGLTVGAVSASAEERSLGVSYTIGGTSDYVFRGISQTLEAPAFQASIDVTYGIAYAGIWGSNVDFGGGETAEIDYYAGFRPVWKSPLGDVTFDVGVLYYNYPNVTKALDYVEIKGGYSMASPFIKNLTTGTTVYYAADYAGLGDAWTVESTASYTLPAVGIFNPSISGSYGTMYGDRGEGFTTNTAGTDDQYSYWNVGLSIGVEKFTFDFRYWDSDLSGVSTVCTNAGICDERFVASAKIVLP